MIRKVKIKNICTIIICPTLSFFSFILMFGYEGEKSTIAPRLFFLSQINTRINCALHAPKSISFIY